MFLFLSLLTFTDPSAPGTTDEFRKGFFVAQAQKDKARAEYDRILSEAQIAIQQQKNAALTDVKNQVGKLVIEVSEKVLRRELANRSEQEGFIRQQAEAVKLN